MKCQIEGCKKSKYRRDWCVAHYRRWLKTGNPLPTEVGPSIVVSEDRNACWGWIGSTSQGYGRFSVNGKRIKAHRLAYQDLVGPIPDGVEVEHRCRNRTCCNPRHLRLATRKQNSENHGGAHRNSQSGVRGVHWDRRQEKWVAQVCHNYQRIWLGYFDSVTEAEAAAIAKRNELFTYNEADRVTAP